MGLGWYQQLPNSWDKYRHPLFTAAPFRGIPQGGRAAFEATIRSIPVTPTVSCRLQGMPQALSGTKPVLPRLLACRGRTTGLPATSGIPRPLVTACRLLRWLAGQSTARFWWNPGARLLPGSGRFSSLGLSHCSYGSCVGPELRGVSAHAAVWLSRGRSAATSCGG